MKIHQRQIPEEGLHIEGEDPAEILDLPKDGDMQALGPLEYTLDIGTSSDGLWATGELAMEMELVCVRCLEKFAYPLHIPDLALQMDRPTTETVDLTPLLREDILLALPAYPHCDWSGERVCPAESKLAEGSVPLAQSDGNGESGPPSAWSTLDQLKNPPRPSSL